MMSNRYEVHCYYLIKNGSTKDVIVCWCGSLENAKERISNQRKRSKKQMAFRVYDTEKKIPKMKRISDEKYECAYEEEMIA